MRTPTYTNVRTITRNARTDRIMRTDAHGTTRVTYPTHPYTLAAMARSARTYRRMVRRTHLANACRALGRVVGWSGLIAATIVVSVLASAYTTRDLVDQIDHPAPHYTRTTTCPTEDSCVPVWNGLDYDWLPVTR